MSKVQQNSHKFLFIIPNAFTVASIICSLYAILNAATTNNDPFALYRSAVAILFACLFDMFDGRIARMTKTQSEFGVHLDSLADTIGFGVAPAVIVYKWALFPLGLVGMLCCAFYTTCGVLRLARFNVISLSGRTNLSTKYFLGLPIPIPATLIASLVIAHFRMFLTDNIYHLSSFIVVLLLVLGLLMVSNVKFWSFKEVKVSKKSISSVVIIACLAVMISSFYSASFALATSALIYITAGLIKEFFDKTKRCFIKK